MAFDNHANLAYSVIATAPSPATSGTSLVVQTGDGAIFPAAPFNATIWPAGSSPLVGTAEIVRVTAKSGDTFTITRTQEGTSARTVVAGDQIAATITAKTITDIEAGSGMVKLFDQTLSGAAATIDTGGGGIPGGYSALQIAVLARGSSALFSASFSLRFNGDSTAGNYDIIWTNNSNGTSTSFISTATGAAKVFEGPGASIGSGIFGAGHVTIPAYDQTTAHKMATALGGFAETSGHSELVHAVNHWASTAAITRIELFTGAGNLVAGSRMTIWGLS